jgi:hypothetical protein
MTRVRSCLVALIVSTAALWGLAGSASAELLLGANGAGNRPSDLLVLNPSTGGVIRTVGPIGYGVTGLSIDPKTGVLYGVTGLATGAGSAPSPGALITINRTTGAGTLVGDLLPGGDGATDITFRPDGGFFGWFETDDIPGTINKATGAATLLPDPGVSTYGGGFDSNSAGVLFLAGNGLQGTLDTVDPNTGQVTTGPTLTGPDPNPGISALAFNSAGQLFGSTTPSSNSTLGSTLIRIDPGSGALTTIGPAIDRLDAIEFVPSRSVVLKKKLKKHGTKVRLFGQITDATDPGCVAGQSVDLQRKKVKSKKAATFGHFRTLQTDSAGNFSTKTKVKTTVKYRAVLPEAGTCDDATSNAKKVTAKKKK